MTDVDDMIVPPDAGTQMVLPVKESATGNALGVVETLAELLARLLSTVEFGNAAVLL